MKIHELIETDQLTPSQLRADSAQHQVLVIYRTLYKLQDKYPSSITIIHMGEQYPHNFKAEDFDSIQVRPPTGDPNIIIWVRKDNPKLFVYCNRLVSQLNYNYEIISTHYSRAK